MILSRFSCVSGNIVPVETQNTPIIVRPNAASDSFCGPNACGGGLSCCGKNQCYNPSQYSCPSDQFGNTALCPIGFGVCNGGCYDKPAGYNCAVDLQGKQVLCPAFYSACDGGCYDARTYSCSTKGLILGTGKGATTSFTFPKTSAAATSAAPKTSTTSKVPSTTSKIPSTSTYVPPKSTFPSQSADLRLINNCKFPLWFEGRYGGQGAPIPGYPVHTLANPGGFVDYTIPATGLPGTRFWAKYGCDSNGRNCILGEQMQYYPEGGCPKDGCTAPIDSLFEATWGCKPGASCYAQQPTTWFDTSQVDGYTIPYKVDVNGNNDECDCNLGGCGLKVIDATRLSLKECPTGEDLSRNGSAPTQSSDNGVVRNLRSVDLRLIDSSSNSIIGCFSPCKKLNWQWGLPEDINPTMYYCCPTPEPQNCKTEKGCITPLVCKHGGVEATQYVNRIHDMAPGIYTYAYDDGIGLHACPAGTVTYTMTFCPVGSDVYPQPLRFL
eukprot:TRINITY_DN5470_c0_g2_i1.p1 TRINITY_DN5470_c0_g2~~TRINITY_DN5470_c0_g2_i1.p1  ORF type:complete len:495 (-),score=145.95 TRINITY_DN5470_c0_g2_i1:142-1626(-)